MVGSEVKGSEILKWDYAFPALIIVALPSLFLLVPAVTVGETEGAMDSASVLFFTSSFAYNFVRK